MKKLQDTEYTGTLPATLQTVAGFLAGYKIWGNTGGVGVETVEGFKLPIVSSSETTNIYIGDTQLAKDEYVDSETKKIYKFKEVHKDTVTINGIVWDILGYNHDEVYNEDGTLAQHTVTIQTHDCVDDVQFDAREALFAFPDGLAAGSYTFTIKEHTWVPTDANKSITFTLTQAVPKGGQLVVNQAYNASFTTGNISSYASSSATEPIETVKMNEGDTGTSLGDVTNAIVDNTNSCQRALFGSNRWGTSALKQLLNSDKAAGTFWKAQTVFDRPPSWAANTAGFLYGMDPDFVSVLGRVKKRTALNTVSDGGSYEDSVEKVFLLSRSEVYADKENNIDEGDPYGYFKDFSDFSAPSTGEDTNRIKYGNGTAKYWWLRSPNTGNANIVRYVYLSGELKASRATYSYGVAPACCIILDDIDSNQWLQDHFLKPTDPPTPFPQIPTFAGETTISYGGAGVQPEKVELDVHGWANTLYSIYHQGKWINGVEKKRVNGKWVANFETIIYGFHVDPSISDPANAVTYLLDAVGKTPATNSSSVVDYLDWADAFFMPKPCMLNYDGTVAYYLDPNDYTKKADGSPSDVANPLFPGNAMMEWSVIWWKFEAGEVEGEMSFYVSNRQVDSTYHCWCNIDAENHITDHFYTAIYNGTSATTYSDSATYAVDDLVTYSSAEYKCTTAVETPEAFDSTKWEKVSDVTRLRSLSGKALTAANGNGNTTGTVEVQRATANNTTATVEWYTDVFSDRQLINGLLTLVSKTLDSSAVYGRGLDSGSRAAKEAYITGTLNDKGLFWGNPSAGTSAKKCFGMENWDGCVWHRTAGLIGSSSTGGYAYKLTYNTADGSTATSYNSTGSGYLVGATGDGTTIARPSDGYVKTMKVASATGIWFPGTVGGNTSTYYCDYYYGGSRYGLAGGRSSYGAHCGCWFLNLGTAFGTADWGVAASPSCKPLASKWKVFEGGDS